MKQNITSLDYYLTRHIKKKTMWLKVKIRRSNRAFMDEYEVFDVNRKYILDIGAGSADTPIYFMKRGASYVVGYEANRRTASLGRANIAREEMQKNIELHNEEVKSLSKLIKRHKIKDALLKIDCEGCEYGLILNCDKRELFAAFKEIMMEYHYGYINLEKHLREAGYATRHTAPLKTDEGMDVGMLYAWRR